MSDGALRSRFTLSDREKKIAMACSEAAVEIEKMFDSCGEIIFHSSDNEFFADAVFVALNDSFRVSSALEASVFIDTEDAVTVTHLQGFNGKPWDPESSPLIVCQLRVPVQQGKKIRKKYINAAKRVIWDRELHDSDVVFGANYVDGVHAFDWLFIVN